jgi:ribosomal protein L31
MMGEIPLTIKIKIGIDPEETACVYQCDICHTVFAVVAELQEENIFCPICGTRHTFLVVEYT